MCRRRQSALILTAVCASSIAASASRCLAADYRFVRVADTRDGALSLAFDRQVVINNAGTVAFYASPSPGLNDGYFSGVGGAVSTIVTDAHPALAGEGFALRSPSYNDSGQIAFFADRATVDGFRVYRADAGGALTLIASTGAGTFQGIQDRPSINNSGNVAFHESGVFGGAYIGNGSGNVKVYGFPDDLQINGTPSLNNVGTMSFPAKVGLGAEGELKHLKGSGGGTFEVIASGSANGVSLFVPSVINDSGLVVYGAFANSTTGIYSGAGGSLVTTLVTTEGPFSDLAIQPGIGAGGFPTLNNAGTIAFVGALDAGGNGIFTGADPTTSQVIAGGTTLFGRSVVDFYGGLSREALNDAGEIVFQAQLLDGAVPSEVVVKAIPATAMKWEDDSDGVWSDDDNWLGPAPNSYHHDANFTDAISAPRTVTVDGSFTVGSINFDNAQRYTIAGATGTVTLDDSYGATLNVVAGSHAIDANLVLARPASIFTASDSGLRASRLQPTSVRIDKNGAGTMSVNRVVAGELHIGNGTLTVLANGTDSGVSRIGTLTISGTPLSRTRGAPGTLDLLDNDLIIRNSSYDVVSAAVAAARHGGAWDLPGLTSSAARDHPTHATNLGVLTGAEYLAIYDTGSGANFGTFAVASTDTLVKFTWNGDANFSGTVNFDDYVRTDVGFNTGLSGWANGDFNYSGSVNFDDYVLLDVAFNTQSGTLGRAVDYLSGDDRSSSGLDDPAVQAVVEHFGQFGLPYAGAFLASVPEPTATGSIVLAISAVCAKRKRR